MVESKSILPSNEVSAASKHFGRAAARKAATVNEVIIQDRLLFKLSRSWRLLVCWWRLVEILRRDCRSRAFVRDPWRSPPCSALCSALLASHSPCDPAPGSSVAASLLLFASSTTLLPLSVKISSGSRRGSIIHTRCKAAANNSKLTAAAGARKGQEKIKECSRHNWWL